MAKKSHLIIAIVIVWYLCTALVCVFGNPDAHIVKAIFTAYSLLTFFGSVGFFG